MRSARAAEWFAIALIAGAWGYMLLHAVAARRFACCPVDPSASEDLLGWMAMAIAMMLPAKLAAIRDVAARSYRARRVRAVCGYMIGYLAWWLAAGVVVLGIRAWSGAHEIRTATVLCVVAAVLAMLPLRARLFRLCHRSIPLCPVGVRADRDAIWQGGVHGWPCVATCAPLMLACTITGHNLVMMAGGTVLALVESRMFRLERRPLVVGALLLAAWTLAL
jgi:hypothetical protein